MQEPTPGLSRRALLSAALATPALPALAQGEWPTRPVRIIVAQPAGGNLDILVRAVADGLRQVLGQKFIVDNRAGGQGVIGLEACANAAPDGTTFCAVNIENMSTAPHVLPELYARYASLRPVTEIATGQAVLVGSLEVPAGATLRDFVAWARGRPGLNYGSSGVGSAQQLVWEWIKAREGLQMEHVPFRGISDAFRELVAGRLHASYGGLALAMPLIREGRIRALAILGSERVADLPDTPSMAELGYDYPYAGPWWGFAAPGGVRDDIVARLAAATRRVVRDEEFHRRALAPHYFSGVGSTPQEFAALIARQREESVELLRLSGLLPAR
jgi:tripartite-type tricarboxylate transporter receptor subunit TctC